MALKSTRIYGIMGTNFSGSSPPPHPRSYFGDRGGGRPKTKFSDVEEIIGGTGSMERRRKTQGSDYRSHFNEGQGRSVTDSSLSSKMIQESLFSEFSNSLNIIESMFEFLAQRVAR